MGSYSVNLDILFICGILQNRSLKKEVVMETVLRRCVLSRVTTAWIFWFVWVCVLFTAWVILAVLLDEIWRPLNHISIYFCIAVIVLFCHLLENFYKIRIRDLLFSTVKSCCSPKLYNELIDVMRGTQLFVQPSFYLISSLVPNASVSYIAVPSLNSLVVTSALLLLEPREVRAVFAHEIAHVKNRDVVGTISLNILLIICMAYSAIYVFFYATSVLGINTSTALAGSILVAVYINLTIHLLSFNPLRRYHEYAADEVGARIHGSSDDLILVLQQSLPFYDNERRTRLHILERIEALENLKRSRPG